MSEPTPAPRPSITALVSEFTQAEADHWLSELRATQDVLSATQQLLSVTRERAWAGSNLLAMLRDATPTDATPTDATPTQDSQP